MEPYISNATMILHHVKHHASYIQGLNDVLVDSDVPDSGPVALAELSPRRGVQSNDSGISRIGSSDVECLMYSE